MSPLHFVIMLIIAIAILTVLTLKFKMHPVMVLFLTATFCGLASGMSLVDTFANITKYFGSTLGSIGVMIIFGAVIAAGINDTGAATSMVNFFIKKFQPVEKGHPRVTFFDRLSRPAQYAQSGFFR